MGYSCTSKARETEAAWEEACRKSTDSSNTWQETDGTEYFFDRGRENEDGAITGSLYRSLPNGMCRKAGTYRINPDGTIARAPKFLKTVKV